MAYNGKTNWQNNEIVEAADMNRVEQGIIDATNDLDTKLPAADYNAADILEKLKTVDGEGSGLDADLFRGLSTSDFATSQQGAIADNILSGAQAAHNAEHLGGVDAQNYAERSYVREYVANRGGDSNLFNDISHPNNGDWVLENVDPMVPVDPVVVDDSTGEIMVPVYFDIRNGHAPRLILGVIDQDIKAGDRIYVSLWARVKEGIVNMSKLMFGNDSTCLIEDMELTNDYKKFDLIFDATGPQVEGGLISFIISFWPSSALGYGYRELEIKSPIAINLTRTYGAAFLPTIDKIRSTLQAFDNSFFWASAPDYSIIQDLQSKVSTLEANISLLLPASSGVVNMGALEAGVVKSEQVSFPSPFASGESITVVVTPNTTNPSSFSLSVPTVSATGFTVNALSESNRSTCWVYWVAIQRPSS